jgi:hypothetical protein
MFVYWLTISCHKSNHTTTSLQTVTHSPNYCEMPLYYDHRVKRRQAVKWHWFDSEQWVQHIHLLKHANNATFSLRAGCINDYLTFTGWLTYFWPIINQQTLVSWQVVAQKQVNQLVKVNWSFMQPAFSDAKAWQNRTVKKGTTRQRSVT